MNVRGLGSLTQETRPRPAILQPHSGVTHPPRATPGDSYIYERVAEWPAS
jgi:hypothetical protein